MFSNVCLCAALLIASSVNVKCPSFPSRFIHLFKLYQMQCCMLQLLLQPDVQMNNKSQHKEVSPAACVNYKSLESKCFVASLTTRTIKHVSHLSVQIWTFMIVSTIIVLDVLFLSNTGCSLFKMELWNTVWKQMSHPDSLENWKVVFFWHVKACALKRRLQLYQYRPPAGEGLFVECPAVALIILFQVCQSAMLHLAAAFVKGDWRCF